MKDLNSDNGVARTTNTRTRQRSISHGAPLTASRSRLPSHSGSPVAAHTSFETGSSLSSPPDCLHSPKSFPSRHVAAISHEIPNSSGLLEDFSGDDGSATFESGGSEIPEGDVSYDSGSEDDDIEALIASKKQRIAADGSTGSDPQAEPHEQYELRERPSKRARRDHKPPKAYLTPPKKDARTSLLALLKARQKEEAEERRIRDLQEKVRLDDEKHASYLRTLEDEDGPLAEKAEQTLETEDDAGVRLKRALRTMDALEQDVRFHFFDSVLEKDPTRLPFPHMSGEWDVWINILKGEQKQSSREKAVLSGFVADLCLIHPLPEELQEWLLGEIIFEDRDEFSRAYASILTACAQYEKTSQLLDFPMLKDSMIRLGAKADIICDPVNDEDKDETNDQRRTLKAGRRGLSDFLLLLSGLRDKLAPPAQEAALYYCNLMLADNDIVGDPQLLSRVGLTVTDLLSAIRVTSIHKLTSRLAVGLVRKLEHPVLVARLISHLPSRSQACALFKRQIAMYASTGYFPTTDDMITSSLWDRIQRVLGSEQFALDEKTGFGTLAARISILEIAIGTGFSDLSFLPAPKPIETVKPPESEAAKSPVAGDSLPEDGEIGQTSSIDDVYSIFKMSRKKIGPPPLGEEEKAFIEAVHSVIKWAKKLNGRIKDAGAAGVKRTECKGVIGGMIVRLEYGVRTRAATPSVF
ncbi:hypothetical protein CAC42_1986 [Sphaceloma murrayae]|uniref:Uncharacterized protein n=1 Tax=Sphaceloma murrayae TaxID=2082308 RepID=A0A2K1QHY5_9PEZI|nr:hypothetical protein CAC42_1986 [Sphaceloma murrayae]